MGLLSQTSEQYYDGGGYGDYSAFGQTNSNSGRGGAVGSNWSLMGGTSNDADDHGGNEEWGFSTHSMQEKTPGAPDQTGGLGDGVMRSGGRIKIGNITKGAFNSFKGKFDKKLTDPVWETVSMKLKKYLPFLNINVFHFKKILRNIINE